MITASKAFIAFCLLALVGTVLVIGPTELRRLLPDGSKTVVAAKPEARVEPRAEAKVDLKPEPKPEQPKADQPKLAAVTPPAPEPAPAAVPAPESKAGARAFPLILPTDPEMPGAAEGKAVAEALRADERPALVLWADSDPVLPFSVGERVSERLGMPAPRPVADAGHFLQEDAAAELADVVARVALG